MALVIAHSVLQREWTAPTRNAASVAKALEELHEHLLSSDSYKGLNPDAVAIIHRDYYEIFALQAVVTENVATFEVAITSALNFYNTTHLESPQKNLLIGLQLLNFLSKQRLAEFHMLLEQIPQEKQVRDPLLAYPVKLEQSLMEGAYGKVALNDTASLPSPFYAPFLKIMQRSVRASVATCIEKAFKQITLASAAKLLFFSTPKDVSQFAASRGWKIVGDTIVFEKVTTDDGQTLDTKRITRQALFYAKQLEMIV